MNPKKNQDLAHEDRDHNDAIVKGVNFSPTHDLDTNEAGAKITELFFN